MFISCIYKIFTGMNHFALKTKIFMNATRCALIELTKRRIFNVIKSFNVE